MSAVTTTGTSPGVPAAPAGRSSTRRPTWLRMLYIGSVLLLLLSTVRLITGAGNLTSAGTVAAALALAVPIGMAGLGGLWSERAGVVNIGLEGMMILGTFGAGWAGYQWGPWAGVLCGVVFGAARRRCCTPSRPSPSASTRSSPVSRSTSSAVGLTQFLAAELFTGVPGGGRPRSRRRSRRSGRVTLPLHLDLALERLRARAGSSSPTWPGVIAGLHDRRLAT